MQNEIPLFVPIVLVAAMFGLMGLMVAILW